ncbi:MAG: radical SAM protein [Actinomycetota bacterium]
MKVTFVYPDYFETQDIHTEPQGRVYLGIGYLSAALKEGGHETDLVHLVRPPGREEFLADLRDRSCDLVAFSATTLQFSKVRMLSAWVKEELDIPTVCGGVHPTIDPGDSVACPSLDYVCVGEGEEALLELCGALESGRDARDVAGIWSRENGEVFRNPPRALVEDLDTVPFPDRSIFDREKFAANQRGRLVVMASRGCPFDCSYCCNHLLKTIYPNGGKYVRFRSPGNVVAEIRAARDQDPGIEQVRFEDDILIMDRSWFREFARLYREEVGLPFICNARVDLLNEEMAGLLADAGCSAITMGVESGSPWLRRNVLRRNMTDEKIRRAFALCRASGIPTVSLNMIGFPHETMAMALQTVKMNADIEPDLAQVTTLCPFPNTEIHRVCLEGGMLGDSTPDTIFGGKSALHLDRMRPSEVNRVCENFVLLMVAYRRVRSLPAPLARAAEAGLDFLIATRLVPDRLRDRVLEGARGRLDWKYFLGVDY